MFEAGERLRDLLTAELRRAVAERIEGGADPREVAADLERRLRWLRGELLQHTDVPP